MKRFAIFFLALACAVSCNFLDTQPKDTINPASYFKTETDLQLFTNPLYNNLLDKEPFANQDDHFVCMTPSQWLRGGDFRNGPSEVGGWSWGNLRRMNTLLGNIGNCEDAAVAAQYEAITRFFRAYFYFEKVVRFGDVPWVEVELGSSDDALYAPRDNREFVMTKILEDIDFAIDNLPAKVSTYRVAKGAALMLKAQICLFEGTFRKYHGLDLTTYTNNGETLSGHDWKYYVDLAAKSSKAVMDLGIYKLAPDYLTLFAEIDADPNEYILAIKSDYSMQIFHNACGYAVMPTQGRPGMTKKFMDSFLMKDGSRFTDKAGWETMQYKEETADRDPRLACLAVIPGYKRIGGTEVLAPDFFCSSTGIQMVKFVMDCTLDGVDRVSRSYNDMPVYRLAEAYLMYAEARAELGELTQEDLDISINIIRDRVKMPHLQMAEANANPDPYLLSETYGYRNVSGPNQGVILEIRRERAIELAQEGRRVNDLIRWKEGKCVEQPMYGPYFPGVGEYDLSGDGKPDVCIYTGSKPNTEAAYVLQLGADPAASGIMLSEGDHGCVDPQQKNGIRVFNEERDYLYPIPVNERIYNPNITQNPGWDDGLDY